MVKLIRSIKQQIADCLRSEVLSSLLKPGVHLSEVQLAERFGVSRGPIREALSQLTSEGLLVAKPNCGVCVATPPTSEDVNGLVLPIRTTIETYALRLIFKELNLEDYHVFEEIILKMELAAREGNLSQLVLLDIDFHRHIITKSARAELISLWEAILVQVRGHFWERTLQWPGKLEGIAEYHRKTVDIFRKGDLELAINELKEHIR